MTEDMETFQVRILVLLEKMVEVEAYDEQDAVEKADEMYKNEEVVLDSADWFDTSYEVV